MHSRYKLPGEMGDNPMETKDMDGDSIGDNADNCIALAKPSQADADNDGFGEACEADLDMDGVIDDTDNCPETLKADQIDADNDGFGEACEADLDNDGV